MQDLAVNTKARRVSRAYCKWQRALSELETKGHRSKSRMLPSHEAEEKNHLLIQFLKDAGLFRSFLNIRTRTDRRYLNRSEEEL